MYEAVSAYWAVFAVLALRGEAAMAYSLCYVSAATTLAVNLAEAREVIWESMVARGEVR